MSFLDVGNVISGYGEGDILHGVSLRVDQGEMVSLIGPNGAGKSTLLKAIVGLLKVRQGEIGFKKKIISGLKPPEITKLGICYVPQEENIFPTLTVGENLEMGAYIMKGGIQKRVEEIYFLFPVLKERRLMEAGTLSGESGRCWLWGWASWFSQNSSSWTNLQRVWVPSWSMRSSAKSRKLTAGALPY